MSNGDDVLMVTMDGPETPMEAPVPLALPPLAVSALMVTKAGLIAALRIYVPHLSDVEAIDGERFLLVVGSHGTENGVDA